MGVDFQGVEQVRRVCLYLRYNLCGSHPGSYVVCVGDVVAGTAHWEASGRILPQGGPQAYGKTTSER